MNHKMFNLFFILFVLHPYLHAGDFKCTNPKDGFNVDIDGKWFREKIIQKTEISKLSWRNFILCNGNINHTYRWRSNEASEDNPFALGEFSLFMGAILTNNIELTKKFLSGALWTQNELSEHAENLVPSFSKKIHSQVFIANLSPLQLALLLGHKEIIELLLDYGADNSEKLIFNKNTQEFSTEDLINKSWENLYNTSKLARGFPGFEFSKNKQDWKTGSKEANEKKNEIISLLKNKKQSKVLVAEAQPASQDAVEKFAVALKSIK